MISYWLNLDVGLNHRIFDFSLGYLFLFEIKFAFYYDLNILQSGNRISKKIPQSLFIQPTFPFAFKDLEQPYIETIDCFTQTSITIDFTTESKTRNACTGSGSLRSYYSHPVYQCKSQPFLLHRFITVIGVVWIIYSNNGAGWETSSISHWCFGNFNIGA